MKGDDIHTAIVPKNKIKTFESLETSSSLEPGLEVKLMVKARAGKQQGPFGVEFRATLCIPNPEKKFYDMIETTNWAEKTKRHLSDRETLQDLGEIMFCFMRTIMCR